MSLTKTPSKSFFNSLQIFRGIAALMVVFHHQWVAFEYFYSAENSFLQFVASLGKYGVDFFFVLSGFIITYSNYNKAGKGDETKTYMINRALRIYLPYLPISLIMIFLYFAFPAASESDREFSLLTSLTLIPDGKPALSVAWTLIHEMMFYLLFLFWFVSKKAWYYFLVIWTFLILGLNFFPIETQLTRNPFVSYFTSYYNLEFILGFLCAVVLRKGYLMGKGKMLLIGFIFFSTAITLKYLNLEIFNHSVNLLLAISFVFIILGFLNTRFDRISSRNLFMILGNASYSIYLVHNPGISILVRVFQKFGGFLPSVLAFILIFVICCVVGIFYSKIFENYLLNLSKKILLPSTAKPKLTVALEQTK